MSQKESEEQGEFTLQDLLKNSEQLRRNLDQQQEERDRLDAMETHGLVEPGGTKKKSSSAEINAMTGQIEHLNSQLLAITEERDTLSVKVSDLTNMLSDRDRQIARLGEQLEAAAELDKTVPADQISQGTSQLDKLEKSDDEPANLSAEQAPKVVHAPGKPAVAVKAKDAPKVPTKPAAPAAPAAAKPWATKPTE